MTRRAVGVLGGMGPAATLCFLEHVLEATGARSDAEHLRILVDINPQVPDRNRAAAGDGPSPGPVLAEMAQDLVRRGAELLCMPCNAAHAWAGEIVAAVDVPFLSIVEAAGAAARAAGGRTGLLAVDATLATGLYQHALPDALTLDAADQMRFMALVRAVKAGDRGTAVSGGMQALAGRLVGQGAEVIVTACTEVPLVLPARAVSVPLIDPARALAREVVRQATAD